MKEEWSGKATHRFEKGMLGGPNMGSAFRKRPLRKDFSEKQNSWLCYNLIWKQLLAIPSENTPVVLSKVC